MCSRFQIPGASQLDTPQRYSLPNHHAADRVNSTPDHTCKKSNRIHCERLIQLKSTKSNAMAASPIAHGPDRSWIPTHSHEIDYFSHKSALAHDEDIPVDFSLPNGFPASIASPTVWTGVDFDGSNQERYILELTADDINELETAYHIIEERNIPFEKITEVEFPLKTLGPRLKAVAVGLTDGIGFFLIRGLDPRRYSSRANIIIYLGISSYIGESRGRQDELGNMLLHLTDVGSEVAPGNMRQAPYSNVGQPFHTDASDIIALYSLGEAEWGGESQLASTATIYNEIAKTRPDIIRLLSSPSWTFDRFGQCPPYKVRPILYSLGEEKMQLSFSRRPLVGNASSPRTPDIPDLSAAHVEAINAVHFAAEEHALSVKLKPGDVLFWNNLALLHGRTGFTDSPTKRRHLIRLWLRNAATQRDWPIPAELQAAWNDAFDHEGREQRWPIEPIREREYIINQQRSSGHA